MRKRNTVTLELEEDDIRETLLAGGSISVDLPADTTTVKIKGQEDFTNSPQYSQQQRRVDPTA